MYARDGRDRPPILLAAAKIAGVDEIYAIGGAQAVAAMAYGTKSVRPVAKIVGPGNIYVATAKRMVFGAVDIDMVAGPSEVLIIADESADPRVAAADLLAQAEHDPLAWPLVVSPSLDLLVRIRREAGRQAALLPRKSIAAESLARRGTLIRARSLAQAVEISNRIAPEHLELAVANPFGLLPLVRNAGAVFLGHDTPEAVGDYVAGPNHVLPTGERPGSRRPCPSGISFGDRVSSRSRARRSSAWDRPPFGWLAPRDSRPTPGPWRCAWITPAAPGVRRRPVRPVENGGQGGEPPALSASLSARTGRDGTLRG